MKWGEFHALLVGLGPETPLGYIVTTRAEEDKEVLKHFTREQHGIRNAWRARKAKKVPAATRDEVLEQLKQAFIKMAGGVGN